MDNTAVEDMSCNTNTTLPIRVLQVLGSLARGGAESRMMDVYRHIDRTKVQFDFAVHTSKPCYFDNEVRSLGGNIHVLPRYRIYNTLQYNKAWSDLLSKHPEYQCVHIHTANFAYVILKTLVKHHIPMRIVHARSASALGVVRKATVKIFRHSVLHKCTHAFAVSHKAAEFFFGKKAVRNGIVTIAPNAIPADAYRYNENARINVRSALRLGDALTIGHVGRFMEAKNHAFLLCVFQELLTHKPNAMLVFAGEGTLMSNIRHCAQTMKIDKHVVFLGERDDVPDLLQAFDVFALPSFYEGLPGVITEALSAGLPCVISDNITRECAIVPQLCTFVPIDIGVSAWVNAIIDTTDIPRCDQSAIVHTAGYDVAEKAIWYEHLYIDTPRDSGIIKSYHS